MADPTNPATPLDSALARFGAEELRDLKAYIQATILPQLGTSPVGVSYLWCGQIGDIPAKHLECSGAAISRTTYADLFAAIGVTHGAGNGTTTFNLPSSRGRVPRGFDNGAGVDPGRVNGTVQEDSVIQHYHYLTQSRGASDAGDSSRPYLTNPGAANSAPSPDGVLKSAGAVDNADAVLDATETRMKNFAGIFIIRYEL